jgi:diamine N-acetyltransferase
MYTIVKAGKGEIELIRTLCFQVWPQTYTAIISQAQIDYMLDMMYSKASLEKQMDDGAEFVIVYDENDPVGFSSFQEIEPGLYKLYKLYVLSSQQGKGTGRLLVDYIIVQMKKVNANALQLQVNKHNKAQHFYKKIGFTIIKNFVFDIGNGYVMDDYVMEKKV